MEKTNNMRTILITGIGGPTPRSIAKSLRRTYVNAKLIGVDANPKAIGFFIQDLVDEYHIAPTIDDNEYWNFIKSLIKKKDIDLAFVQPEREVIGWGEYFSKYGEYPCPVLIPNRELASVLIDKAKMAEVLEATSYIPSTIKVSQGEPKFELIKEMGFPCWIRATQGSGGLGSLKLMDINSYKSWLFINNDIAEFTVSEFLEGRHIATQMLYHNGRYIKGASLECVEYVMANIAPSKVTGNTSFGRFINEDHVLKFCNECIEFICKKLNTEAHGVLSFDLKEDSNGELKVTEVNIRHMAYTGVMAQAGFDLSSDTVRLLEEGIKSINQAQFYHYNKPYIFLRDVDIEPILLESESLIKGKVKL
jgi:glutathione synthase/RimK-type ligase-like ATP-grasp enzyme